MSEGAKVTTVSLITFQIHIVHVYSILGMCNVGDEWRALQCFVLVLDE